MGAVFWPVVAVGAFLIWIVVAFVGLPDRPRMPLIQVWRPRHPRMFMLAFAIAALGLGIRYLFPQPNDIENWLLSFLVDLAPEMVGMAFTVVVIDELNQQLAERQEKERIIRQMGSHSNDFALEAVRLVRENGWHEDGSLRKRNFAQANLRGANLEKASLQGVNLREANLQGANLEKANLQGANLQLAKLQEANLVVTNLQGADLGGANLQGANLQLAKLQGADLMWADLQGADLAVADLQGADLAVAKLQGAKLMSAKLQGASLWLAKLQGADLLDANLQEANLANANLQEASLENANLQGANLVSANLQESKYTAETIWPEDFDPKAARAILLEYDEQKQE